MLRRPVLQEGIERRVGLAQLDAQRRVEIAGSPAGMGRHAAAAQPQLRAAVGPGGNAHPDRPTRRRNLDGAPRAVDIDDGKLALAKELGADMTVTATHGGAAEAVKKGTSGGAHGVLITAPSLGAFKQGVEMTRKRGTCVLVGLPPGDFPVPLFDVVANCITIRGSFVGNREDMAEALAFAADGKVKTDIELEPLSAINEVFYRLEHGKVAARVVIYFASS
jgi:D-arabinose 1-dehydrogenase-like Zn-dependent alcohol dehydrogenase